MVVAGVAAQSIIVGVKSKRKKTVRTECFKTAVFTDGKWGGAATIVKN